MQAREVHQLPELRYLAIVPAFNEAESVAEVCRKLHRSLPQFDVIVIDDGSSDGTARCVPETAVCVRLPFNLGIGGAMQTGYRYAALNGYDVAVQVDGDGQHRPEEVIRLVRHLLSENLDLVVGSRFLEDRPHYRQTTVRKSGGWMLQTMIRMLTGLKITDCTSGFRATSRKVIEAFAHWYPEDYPEPEVILLLQRGGFKVGELSVRMRRRKSGQSSISLLRGIFYVLKVGICLLLDTARHPWPKIQKEPGAIDGPENIGATFRESHRDPQPDPAGVRWRSAAPGHPPTPPV